jgi:hypothetical protein
VKAAVAQERTTLRVVVLRALLAAGFDIDDADCVDRRAEATRARAALYRAFVAKRSKGR